MQRPSLKSCHPEKQQAANTAISPIRVMSMMSSFLMCGYSRRLSEEPFEVPTQEDMDLGAVLRLVGLLCTPQPTNTARAAISTNLALYY